MPISQILDQIFIVTNFFFKKKGERHIVYQVVQKFHNFKITIK